MGQLVFDESLLPRLEALYRTHDVLRRRRLVREAVSASSGERVLDAGCGPGFYVAELLEEVGPEGAVTGVDGSAQMLQAAARRCEGHANVAFHEADVTSLPVDDASFDAALSVQVLEYVSDVASALAEMHRAVKPGGRVVVWDVDWATVSVHSSDPDRTARVLRAWDAHLAHPSLPQTLAARLRAAGFDDVAVEGHAFATSAFVSDAYGASIVPLIEQFVAGREGITEDEAKAWGDEQRELGERGEFFFACTQFCFTATRTRE
jgi:ubiquinone/menaquinone biosynthesis C-methylase UbiE